MNELYSLQDAKDNYYRALSWGMIEHMGLNEYLKEFYIQTYDNKLNFIGYQEVRNEQVRNDKT